MNLKLPHFTTSLQFLAASAAILTALPSLSLSAGSSTNQIDETGAGPTPTPFQAPAWCNTSGEDYSKGELLSFRLLSADDGPLLLDETEWQTLADEIDGVLGRVFTSSDDVPVVPVRRTYLQGRLSIGLEQALGDTLDPGIWESDALPPISLGVAETDSLNSQLGLSAIVYPRAYTSGGYSMLFCLDPLVNVHSARLAYEGLPGVSYSSLSGLPGDTSDIAVGKADGTWYVVLREAFGDCPSGCIGQILSYFSVTESAVIEICEVDALEDPFVRQLASTWGEQRLPAEPAACQPSSPISLPKTGGHP